MVLLSNEYEGQKVVLGQLLCCFTQNKNGHALTLNYSSIEGALNNDIHAENCEYIESFNVH